MRDLFRGEFVRLTAEDPEFRAKQEARWQSDTEFHRLASAAPAEMFSAKRIQQDIEKTIEDGFGAQRYFFSMRSLVDDHMIGFLALWLDLIQRDVWFGVSIGERDYWGKGHGTDATKLCLQYSFMELNAERVSLIVYEYNPRAFRVYEKAGFRLEGRTRKDVSREGKRYDSIWMGILREEWLRMQVGEQ